MRSIERPQPLALTEIRAWLNENGEKGARRRSLFTAIRTLDRVWRQAFIEDTNYE